MTVRDVSVVERRARLACRHGFAARHADMADLAGNIVGIHSTDPVSVYLALAARRTVAEVADVERHLYEDRGCLRMLGMRRTLFVVPVGLTAVVQRAYTDGFVAKERRRLAGWLEHGGVTKDGSRHIERMERLVFGHLDEVGEASTRDLTAAVPELDERFVPPVGGAAATLSVGSRVVLLLTAAGRLARTRPLGSWISSQYRYARMEHWLGGPITDIEPAEARAALARQWLAGFGPGTETDLKWWTGWTVGHTRAALRAVGAVEVRLDGGANGFVLADDVDPVEEVDPWAALLPALDATPMGWKDRDWYLGDHTAHLFDRNGNVGPTVWWDGRVVGGWAQRSDGEIVVRYLEDVPAEGRSQVDAEITHLTNFIGPTRFIPRFRTPLERVLSE
jgi:hypothetical protein